MTIVLGASIGGGEFLLGPAAFVRHGLALLWVTGIAVWLQTVFNTELMEVVELGFLLECADALVAAALARDESRGGHYREDHPLRDDANWLKHSLGYREDDGSVRLEHKPVKLGPYVPMERKY